jgi:hypothetical protein
MTEEVTTAGREEDELLFLLLLGVFCRMRVSGEWLVGSCVVGGRT